MHLLEPPGERMALGGWMVYQASITASAT